jgi:hypothetical protein
MKSKKTMFGAALITLRASGALLSSTPSLARSEDDAVFDSDQDGAFLQHEPRARVSDLAGAGAISRVGNTGCGLST